jgi:hypothetical protein
MRLVDRDLIRGGHYGQRSCEPHQKAEHMAAPTNAAKCEESSCQPGAVHTWHIASVIAARRHVRCWRQIGSDRLTAKATRFTCNKKRKFARRTSSYPKGRSQTIPREQEPGCGLVLMLPRSASGRGRKQAKGSCHYEDLSNLYPTVECSQRCYKFHLRKAQLFQCTRKTEAVKWTE